MSVWTDPIPEPDLDAAQAAVVAAEEDLAAAQQALQRAEQGQPVDPDSTRLVKELATLARRPDEEAWIDTSIPVYTVPADQPTVPVNVLFAYGGALQKAFDAVPIPVDAKPSGASNPKKQTDHVLIIHQPDTGKYWETWVTVKDADGAWHARWGGATDAYSTTLYTNGAFGPGDWLGAAYNWGASASSLLLKPGLATSTEFQAALDGTPIDHALALLVPDARPHEWAWPAQRTDGLAGVIPYGARYYLPKGFDLESVHNPQARVLADVAQRHGLVVRDKTWHAVSFAFQRPADGEPKWSSVLGSDYGRVTQAFPWEELVVAPMDLRSKPGPARTSTVKEA